MSHSNITVIDYNLQQVEERQATTAEELAVYKGSGTVTWINVDGTGDAALIEGIGDKFGLHPLILEDIVHTEQRPKCEDYEQYVFLVLKMFYLKEGTSEVVAEQVSLVLFDHCVISFQERPGDVFDNVRQRIRTAKGRIRKMGADYLAYALLDAVVDGYYVILESIGERVEEMQEQVFDDPSPEVLRRIYELKRQTGFLRKTVWPLREVAVSLERGEFALIKKATRLFLRDLYDHTIQVIDTIETFRDTISGMLDMYMSSVSNRMNEVMKVLTIIATIFIPVTFIAGVYGMNFEGMPELRWPWAYPAVLALMAGVGLVMVVYFRRKRWI